MAADQKRTSSKELENGDVIKVCRKTLWGWLPLYDHYGIYAEDTGSVIHYQEPQKGDGRDSEASGGCVDFHGEVRETSLEECLGGAESFTVCRYPEKQPLYPLCFRRETFEVRYDTIKNRGAPAREAVRESPGAEAVKNARSCIGKRGYNLAKNNCEHFAVACRYNYHASGQVQGWVTALGAVSIVLGVILMGILTGGKRRSSGSDEDETGGLA